MVLVISIHGENKEIKLRTPANLIPSIARIFREELTRTERVVKTTHFGGATTARTLKVRSGHGRASFSTRVEQSGDSKVQGMVGVMEKSAAIYLFRNMFGHTKSGATSVSAKSGKHLGIPLPYALTPSGVLKAPPRQWKNTFFAKSKKGNLLMFTKVGDESIPIFLLKDKVKVPHARIPWAALTGQLIQRLKSRINMVVTK